VGSDVPGPEILWESMPDGTQRPAVDLDGLAAACAASRHSSEATLSILEAAAEYFERGMLLLREGDALLPVGAIIPHGDRPPASLLTGQRLPIGADVVSLAASSGAHFVGDAPGDRANVEALRFLGAERPGRIAAVPLTFEGACFAVLYGDDAGDGGSRPDLAPFLRFVGESAPSLRAAMDLSAAREQARQARLSP
jgi:hypothetical protein